MRRDTGTSVHGWVVGWWVTWSGFVGYLSYVEGFVDYFGWWVTCSGFSALLGLRGVGSWVI